MDRLSPLDATWLHLERDVQQLHVGSALLFEGPAPSYAEFCAAIGSRLDLVPRYRQRVLRVPLELGRPVWADDLRFSLGDHVRQATLPGPGTEASLCELAAGIMSEHLDLSRPLWETWLVDGLEGGRPDVVGDPESWGICPDGTTQLEGHPQHSLPVPGNEVEPRLDGR